ncbi:MAG TPA: cache domain-containing protein [Syntrophorhabdaceae bacterium]|nr:cache domain-containing protein [Syntrophorhabdaceae bacterium]
MRKRRVLFFFALFVLVCVFLFLSLYYEARREAIESLNAEQMLQAKQAARGVEDFFADWTRDLSTFSEMDAIKNIDRTGRGYLESLYRHNTGLIRSFTRLDARGRIIYSAPYDRSIIGKDVSSLKHVREIIQTHQPVTSDVFMSARGYKTIALHVPVWKGGTFQGTLAATFNFEALAKKYLEVIKTGRAGYAWVISRDGTELFCPIPGHVENSVFQNAKDCPSILAMADNMLEKRQGAAVYTCDNVGGQKTDAVRMHAVFMPVSIGRTFWSIVVTSPETEVLSSLAGFRNRLILVGGIFLLGCILISYYGVKAWFVVREEEKRRHTEETLRESEEKFRLLFEKSADPILLLHEGRFIDYNEAAVRFLGSSDKEHLIGLTPAHLSPERQPDGRLSTDKAQEMIATALKSGAHRFEWVHRAPNGQQSWAEVSLTAVPVQGKNIPYTVWRDIGERKRAEEALRESEKRFRSLVETTSDGCGRWTRTAYTHTPAQR